MNGDSAVQGWHLDKRVSVGHLITTLAVIGTLIAWGISVERRMTKAEVEIEHLINDTVEIKESVRDSMTEIKTALRDINLRLDNILQEHGQFKRGN